MLMVRMSPSKVLLKNLRSRPEQIQDDLRSDEIILLFLEWKIRSQSTLLEADALLRLKS